MLEQEFFIGWFAIAAITIAASLWWDTARAEGWALKVCGGAAGIAESSRIVLLLLLNSKCICPDVGLSGRLALAGFALYTVIVLAAQMLKDGGWRNA